LEKRIKEKIKVQEDDSYRTALLTLDAGIKCSV
jgi:hypothetical protein